MASLQAFNRGNNEGKYSDLGDFPGSSITQGTITKPSTLMQSLIQHSTNYFATASFHLVLLVSLSFCYFPLGFLRNNKGELGIGGYKEGTAAYWFPAS